MAPQHTVTTDVKPVAICTLADNALHDALSELPALEGVVIGTLATENIGIEHIVQYALTHPNIRFLIVCGEDGRQAIGHLPGQSLMALHQNGIDDSGTIIGAEGKRPVIRNLPKEAVEHFRQSVEVLDLIGCQNVDMILEAVEKCIAKNPGPAEPFGGDVSITPSPGFVRERVVMDPCGYFVVLIDRFRRKIILQHYLKDGVLHTVLEGETAQELYTPVIEWKLISMLEHAAYLGRELAWAETALKEDRAYQQDTPF